MHSRAARRETSPGIDTDKSLKFVKPPQDDADRRSSVLSAHSGGGISKSSKRKQVLSSKAKRRQAKSMDRAEAIMDRTAKKVEKSKGQAKVTYSRRRTWEEINSETANAKPRPKFFSKEMEEEDDYVKKFYADDDEEMDEVDEAVPSTVKIEVPLQVLSVPDVTPLDDDNEIL